MKTNDETKGRMWKWCKMIKLPTEIKDLKIK